MSYSAQRYRSAARPPTQYQTTLALEFKDSLIARGDESLALLFDDHVQITVSQAIFPDVMIHWISRSAHSVPTRPRINTLVPKELNAVPVSVSPDQYADREQKLQHQYTDGESRARNPQAFVFSNIEKTRDRQK